MVKGLGILAELVQNNNAGCKSENIEIVTLILTLITVLTDTSFL